MMRVLGVFAKYWQPGKVKTRLAPELGLEKAAEVHRALLRCTLDRTLGCADKHLLVFTPHDRREEFHGFAGSRWQLVSQRQGDLGARLGQFFQNEQASRADSIVVIGSDSPNLPTDLLKQAYEALERVPVVLGPSTDGGYYLIGLRGEIPPIFENVDWGTPLVWQQTLSLLKKHDIAMEQLPPWYDVDLADDLQRLRGDLSGRGDLAGAELARELQRICDL